LSRGSPLASLAASGRPLFYMRVSAVATVCSVLKSAAATPRFVRPAATSGAMWRSVSAPRAGARLPIRVNSARAFSAQSGAPSRSKAASAWPSLRAGKRGGPLCARRALRPRHGLVRVREAALLALANRAQVTRARGGPVGPRGFYGESSSSDPATWACVRRSSSRSAMTASSSAHTGSATMGAKANQPPFNPSRRAHPRDPRLPRTAASATETSPLSATPPTASKPLRMSHPEPAGRPPAMWFAGRTGSGRDRSVGRMEPQWREETAPFAGNSVV
jgi:hypothetical protein